MKFLAKAYNFVFKMDGQRLTARQRYIEEYLSESVDRCDLERRERELTRRGFF